MVTTFQVGPVAPCTKYKDGFYVDDRDCSNSQIQKAQGYIAAGEIPIIATTASKVLLGLAGLAVLKVF